MLRQYVIKKNSNLVKKKINLDKSCIFMAVINRLAAF